MFSSRTLWPKFGEAAKTNKICWSVTDPVEVELTHPELKPKQIKWNNYESYVAFAMTLNWPSTDLMQLKEAESTKDMFMLIYKRKEATLEAQQNSKFSHRISAIESAYVSSLSAIKKDYERKLKIIRGIPEDQELPCSQPAAEAAGGTGTAEEPAQAQPVKSLGIRGRFNAKVAERKQKEETNPTLSTASSSGVGLSARLKQMKQDKQDTEQDSTLFVSNISEDTDENELRAVLKDFQLRRINFVRKGGPSHTGAGFVVLAARDEATRCVEFLNGYRLNHLVLQAAFSKPREDNNK
jgi:hypothetical protein